MKFGRRFVIIKNNYKKWNKSLKTEKFLDGLGQKIGKGPDAFSFNTEKEIDTFRKDFNRW